MATMTGVLDEMALNCRLLAADLNKRTHHQEALRVQETLLQIDLVHLELEALQLLNEEFPTEP